MNQRPFISTQLSIFDENRCVFSPSMIAGQPVMISQEQNRKICDSLTTAIASNQPRNCFCASSPVYTNQQQVWSCPLQAQKQGIPGGVAFNFSQPNYCCPPSCLPSVYNPPPPPCPQVVECPNKTPQSICVDFGKFGMEALMFQQKCRQQCQGFTYDKQVGTSDQIIFPKCNTCCCGVQSVTLNAEQKEEIFHKVDESDSKSKFKISACDPKEKRRCGCFPKPDPNKFGSAKNLVIGERKERSCKDYDIVDQATREADAEAYLCCNCLDQWKKENEKRRPSCLKKRCECSTESQKEGSDVSFCFRGRTLEITEEKPRPKPEDQTTSQSKIGDVEITNPQSDEAKSDIVKHINEMKKKRKGIVKMAQDFRITAKGYLEQLDRDIDHYRDLYKSNKIEKKPKENFIQRYRCEYLFDNTEFETVEEREGKNSKRSNIRATAKTREGDIKIPAEKKEKDIPDRKQSIPPKISCGTYSLEKVINIIPPDNDEKEWAVSKSDAIKTLQIKSPNIETSDPGNSKSESNSDSEKPMQFPFAASSANVEKGEEKKENDEKGSSSNSGDLKVLMEQVEIEILEEIITSLITESLNKNQKDNDNLELGEVKLSDVPLKNVEVPFNSVETGTSRGEERDTPAEHNDDDNLVRHYGYANIDQMENEKEDQQKTSLDSKQAVVEYSEKNDVNQKPPEESHILKDNNLDGQKEELHDSSKPGTSELNGIMQGKTLENNDPPEFAEEVTKQQNQSYGKQAKVCGGSCAKREENNESNQENIIESKQDNIKETDSTRNIREARTNYKEITEDNFSENKDGSTTKKNEPKQPDDHVSFSAQQSEEFVVIKKEDREKPSTSNPQKEEVREEEPEAFCGEKSACRRIIQCMYDRDDEEPRRSRCDIKEIYEFCNCCSCNVDDGLCCKESKNLVFKPCVRERNTTNIFSNIYSSAMEKAGNLLSYISSFRSPCSPLGQPFYENPRILTDRYGCGAGCYARRIRRHVAGFNVPRNVCPCRMDTNRFCGKTCYDNDTNRWYSCCEGFADGQKVVKITFKETAERRTVRLDNNCRNCRYHVVYE